MRLLLQFGSVPGAGDSDFATLKVSGAGNVVFDNSAGGHGVTVDASAMTGVLTVETTVGFADSVTLGGGKDVVILTSTGALNETATSTYSAIDTITSFAAGDHLTGFGATTGNLTKADVSSAVSLTAINELASGWRCCRWCG